MNMTELVDTPVVAYVTESVYSFTPINSFSSEFLKYTLLSLILDMSIVANGGSLKNPNPNGQQCRS